MDLKDDALNKLLDRKGAAYEPFLLSSVRSDSCILARTPTSSRVLEVSMQASMNPDDRDMDAGSSTVELKSIASCSCAYADSGGKLCAIDPDIDE